MNTLSELKDSFKKVNINLFEAIENSERLHEIIFLGDKDLLEFIEYMKMNRLDIAFYNHSEVTIESLIDLELITEYEFGINVNRYQKEAKEYNDLVENHMGKLLSAAIFTIHNGLLLKVHILSDLQDKIAEDGESALDDITREYYFDVELYKLEREEEILREIEEEKAEYKQRKIKMLYELLDKDLYFSQLTTKDGKILRATELASQIGIKETKTNIIGHLDLYNIQRKRRTASK